MIDRARAKRSDTKTEKTGGGDDDCVGRWLVIGHGSASHQLQVRVCRCLLSAVCGFWVLCVPCARAHLDASCHFGSKISMSLSLSACPSVESHALLSFSGGEVSGESGREMVGSVKPCFHPQQTRIF